mmetsp:Transcript_56075/g.149614  ORF Transcript_56075/g.149614 Transcript_56075/m.149614 type:complete len:279 (+) Transcript_56075:139-975(+)
MMLNCSKRTWLVSSLSSSQSNTAFAPAMSAIRSSHFKAGFASTASFNVSNSTTRTGRCCWACAGAHSMSICWYMVTGTPPAPPPLSPSACRSSAQFLNHSARSSEPLSPLGSPILIFSASRDSVVQGGPTVTTFSPERMSSISSYRSSAALASVVPAFSAMEMYAVRKFLCSAQVNGPGLNSSSRPSPPCKRTIIQVMLSFEFVSTALWQMAVQATPASFVSLIFSAANWMTSAFEKSPSDTPSHTKTTKSVSSQSNSPNSGSAVMGLSSGPGPPVVL